MGACTIQGQYAILQLDFTKLHQMAMEQSHFFMTRSNTRFNEDLGVPAQTTHESPNGLIGCIISKINKIHQIWGADQIFSNLVEGSTDKQVTSLDLLPALSWLSFKSISGFFLET
ncbi:hypothetical protein U0070_024244, partial [Myodes glareolus]